MEFKLCQYCDSRSNADDHYWKEISKPRLEVLVVGANNTGASYMKSALEGLFHEPCLHFNDLHQSSLNCWLGLYQTKDLKLQKELLSYLLNGYRTASGYPTAAFLEILLQCYPDMKVILTVRDAEKWLASSRRTILSKRSKKNLIYDKISEELRKLFGLKKMDEIYIQALQLAFGETTDLMDDTALINAYIRWNESVKKIVPTDRLLVYNVKEGWVPLCSFLNLPVPNTPFPGSQERPRAQLWIRNNLHHLKSLVVCCLLYMAIYVLVFHVYFLKK